MVVETVATVPFAVVCLAIRLNHLELQRKRDKYQSMIESGASKLAAGGILRRNGGGRLQVSLTDYSDKLDEVALARGHVQKFTCYIIKTTWTTADGKVHLNPP